ncbi:hypothetical protein [Leptolyngbya sp. FACHB-711]|uniref:hypothetical protein n=1 Tax=unclassified Leptolyngbya TaxID=2650499 RepID=UPI001686CF6B|nr:hypothetical protein [Leptolyngbya sp. FACHB-711]MBD1852138.1 hypothetical protein [Cyanobacteria bacterium FACHB-502]MBD2027056.1 hypothetical protein [Leptolyngbya sp. FACHB-711]
MFDVLDRIAEIDGRYATDQELVELEQLSQMTIDRFQLYSKLAQAEERILNELYQRVSASHPQIFQMEGRDVSVQCRHDVRYTFHHAVQSMLLGEAWLQEDLLIWFQTITRSRKIQPRCEVVYSALENLLRSALPPKESQLICPIIRKIKETLIQP